MVNCPETGLQTLQARSALAQRGAQLNEKSAMPVASNDEMARESARVLPE